MEGPAADFSGGIGVDRATSCGPGMPAEDTLMFTWEPADTNGPVLESFGAGAFHGS